MSASIALLPGDGIGPEVVAAATRVLDTVGEFTYAEHPFGGAAIDAARDAAARRHARRLPARPTPSCSPPWADRSGTRTDPRAPRPEQGLLGLRKELGLFANLRPVRPLPALYDASPLRRDCIEGTDLVVVRELTGGHLLRRPRSQRRPRARHLRLHGRGDRAHRPHRLPRRRARA